MPPSVGEFQWATDHAVTGPLIAQFRQFALDHGLDQVSKMMSLYATNVVHECKLVADARAAEISKLGATASARVMRSSRAITTSPKPWSTCSSAGRPSPTSSTTGAFAYRTTQPDGRF